MGSLGYEDMVALEKLIFPEINMNFVIFFRTRRNHYDIRNSPPHLTCLVSHGTGPRPLTHHFSRVVTWFSSRIPKCFASNVFFDLPYYTHFLSPALVLRALLTSAFLTWLAQLCFFKLTNYEASKHIILFIFLLTLSLACPFTGFL
jgi:hypothetical protein